MEEAVGNSNLPGVGTEEPAMRILQILKTVMLSLQLTNEKCFETLFIEGSYLDANCLKLVGKYWGSEIVKTLGILRSVIYTYLLVLSF